VQRAAPRPWLCAGLVVAWSRELGLHADLCGMISWALLPVAPPPALSTNDSWVWRLVLGFMYGLCVTCGLNACVGKGLVLRFGDLCVNLCDSTHVLFILFAFCFFFSLWIFFSA
jgi:hypothetical protein